MHSATTSPLPELTFMSESDGFSTSYYDPINNILSLEIKNNSNSTASGYDNAQYRDIFEVSTSSSEWNNINNQPANQAFEFWQDGYFHKWYTHKKVGMPSLTTSSSDNYVSKNGVKTDDLTVQTMNISETHTYYSAVGAHQPNEVHHVKLSLIMKSGSTNGFTRGKFYMATPDSQHWARGGDNWETIEPYDRPTNDCFVFYIP